MSTKVCEREACGTEYTRPPDTSDMEWLQRRYCTLACANQARARVYPTGRTCEGCTEPLVPRDGERVTAYSKRRFCGRVCANRQRRVTPDRQCRFCGMPLVRRDTEQSVRFTKRRFCDTSCANRRSHSSRPSGAQPRRRKATAPVAAPVAEEPRAPWRPAGFAPTPLGRQATTRELQETT